ncbi:MAG TPA: Asp-tRNA(Asn)/Glu-tRNA(Gln) amidotransferase subunit GatB, partial [Candidatus Paceibacterota bacterium]|nr:Asp-tRNA(Asn)/Glu-tRNA(Gln) amidotransferase subunit GatB [Candidatus Paceibacterota bacterium]
MMTEYLTTIGLEVHAELNTATKMFCDCANDPLEKRPNMNVCPICMGHPGTLPVANHAAIEKLLQVGLALGCSIEKRTFFERKNYFYPDLPKGYQISQYQMPF